MESVQLRGIPPKQNKLGAGGYTIEASYNWCGLIVRFYQNLFSPQAWCIERFDLSHAADRPNAVVMKIKHTFFENRNKHVFGERDGYAVYKCLRHLGAGMIHFY
jgi:hypothetical protein